MEENNRGLLGGLHNFGAETGTCCVTQLMVTSGDKVVTKPVLGFTAVIS